MPLVLVKTMINHCVFHPLILTMMEDNTEEMSKNIVSQMYKKAAVGNPSLTILGATWLKFCDKKRSPRREKDEVIPTNLSI